MDNRTVSFADLFGSYGCRLAERLQAAPSWDDRFAILDGELRTRIAESAAAPRDLCWAWQEMVRSHGRCSILNLANELGFSRKHFSGRFHAEWGLQLKTMANILRFREVVDALRHDASQGLAGIAIACGYYDQAHLNRDFRRFAGITPSEYRRMYTPDFGLRAE